jgi:hypothetical protein
LERRFHSKGATAERRLHLVHTRSELTDAMPRFVTAYLEAQLSA